MQAMQISKPGVSPMSKPATQRRQFGLLLKINLMLGVLTCASSRLAR